MSDARRRSLITLCLATVLWASTPVLIKLVPLGAFAQVSSRSSITAVLLLALVGWPRRLNRVDLLRSVFQAATTVGFIVSTSWGTPEAATVLFYTAPIISALGAPLLAGRRPRGASVAAALTVALGIWLVVRHGLAAVSVGAVVAGLGGAVCYSTWAELSRRVRPHVAGQDLVVGMALLGALFAPAFVSEVRAGARLGLFESCALAAGATIAALGFFWIDRALRHISPTAVVLISAAEVPLVFLWTMPFFRTVPTLESAAGGLLVFAAVAWMGIHADSRDPAPAVA